MVGTRGDYPILQEIDPEEMTEAVAYLRTLCEEDRELAAFFSELLDRGREGLEASKKLLTENDPTVH